MISTGIDLVSVDRIRKTVKKNPRFITRFFGIEEQELFSEKTKETIRIQTIAGNFAAKEAFSKAMGSGISGFSMDEVEVLREPSGQPYIKLCGKAQKLLEGENAIISVSISHTVEFATAIVLIEKH